MRATIASNTMLKNTHRYHEKKTKRTLFEKLLTAHLADRVSVARVTVMIFFKIVTEMFYSFFQMPHFFSNISVLRLLENQLQ